jgi:ABC-type dipeptide/oligopeptide/nickel transport system permease component
MFRFIVRRMTFVILICILIIFFSHLGMRMIRNSEISRPDYDVVKHGQLAWQDTLAFLRRPVLITDELRMAYVNSMGLMLVALASAAVLGLYIGAVAALTSRRRLVLPLLTLTILGISTPSFFAGLLLQQGELRFLALTGRRLVSMAGFGWDFQHMLMPVLVLAARPLAYLTRASFLSLSRVMEEDYIRTAFAKGLSFRRTVNVHALRNIAVPVLTALGVSLRFSLSTLPVVEFFFAWPGMGLRLLEAMNARRTTVVVTLACALGLTFLLTNLLLDVVYRLVDPRMREL